MIKLEALESFRLQRFNELKNLVRAGKEEKGFVNKGDTFECEKDLADYLLGSNPLKKPVAKVIEVKVKEPEFKNATEVIISKETIEALKENKPKKKKSKK